MNRDEWVATRPSFIGASESPAILGHGYVGQSPVSIWLEKAFGERLPVSPDQLRRMNRGTRMEPIIAAEFEEETGMELMADTPGEYTILRHPAMSFVGCTLDRRTVDGVPVELKYVSGRMRREWEGEQPPLKYLIQVQHQLAVTGADFGYLVALVGGEDLFVKQIVRHESFIEALLGKLTEFWGYVQRQEMPPVDGSEATSVAIATMFPRDDGEAVDLPGELVDVANDLDACKRIAKETDDRIRELENTIKAAIGDASCGRLPDGSGFTWKTRQRKAYPVKASEYRVLRRLELEWRE